MLRSFAGVLDLGDGSGRDRALQGLPRAVPGGDVRIADAGVLVVGVSGGLGESDGVVVAVDGGIYNGDTLAAELDLDPTTPLENALATGFRRFGAGLAPRLRGEYAALIWDRERRRGLVLQDQFGVRRVFMHSDGRRLWFGSEVRNLLRLLPARPAPDRVAVSHWVAQVAPPGGATLYEGVSGLETGQLAELDTTGWTVRRYWRPTYREPAHLDRDELVQEIRASLQRAVARRTIPGAPTGVLMSGGLDSTSIAALAHHASDEGAVGFSAMFPDYPEVDESTWIDAMDSSIGLPVVRYPARGPGLVASGLEFLRNWELPSHTWSEAWIQPLLQQAGDHGVSVILSGTGGDELFGSRYFLIADMMRKGRLLAAARFAQTLPEVGGPPPRKVLAEILWGFGVEGLPPAAVELAWRRTVGRRKAAPWWASTQCAEDLRSGGVSSWRDSDAPRWWAFHTHALTVNLHGNGLLDHARRRSEQLGLEARHPLLDLDLFELMMGVDPALCSTGSLTRPLLRDSMAGISPDEVRLRPYKSIFDQVIVGAMVGPELPAIRSILGEATHVWDYADRRGVQELLQKPPPLQREQPAIWAGHVLRLTAIEVWLRFQEDRSLPERLLAGGNLPLS